MNFCAQYSYLSLFTFFISLAVALNSSAHADEITFSNEGPFIEATTLVEHPMVPAFDWSMADRYGPTVDANDNGIVDLPNIREYVLNRPHQVNKGNGCPCISPNQDDCDKEPARFRVHFDATESKPARSEIVRKPEDELQIESDRIFKETGKRPRPAFVKSPDPKPHPSFSWSIYDMANKVTAHRGEGPVQDVCLAEGHYRVILNMKQGNLSQTLVRTADIVDHLIVLLGDSFAAGEGAPERLYEFEVRKAKDKSQILDPIVKDLDVVERLAGSPVQWADDGIGRAEVSLSESYAVIGQKAPMRTVTVFNADPFERQEITVHESGDKKIRPLLESERIRAEHRVSHRSSFTHASQFAIELEAASKRSSVTFINLAQTGATISTGVMGEYSGARNEIKEARIMMRPQIDDLRDLVTGRSIDDLFMSIGGNDVGFAYLIATLVAGSESDNDFAQIENMFETGDWGNIGWDQVFALALKNPETGKFPSTIGFNFLGSAYGNLALEFDDMRDTGLLSGPVTLIAPPFFGSSHKTGWRDLRDGNIKGTPKIERISDELAFYCAENVDTQAKVQPQDIITDFSPEEFKWVDEKIYPRLIKKMRESAAREKINWRFIEQGNLPGRHGLCGTPAYSPLAFNPSHPIDYKAAQKTGQSWYRSVDEAAAIQTGIQKSNLGMFHPNEFGYAHVRELIKAQYPAMAIEFEGASYIDADDSIDEAIAANSGFVGNSRTFSLTSPQDVHIVRSSVGAGRTLHLRVDNSNGDPVALHLFSENGQLLASTASDHKVDMNTLKSVMDDFGFGNGNDSITATANITVPTKTSDIPVNAIDEHSLVYKSPLKQNVFLAISNSKNVWFDPVTGSGDDWTLNGGSSSVEVSFVE